MAYFERPEFKMHYEVFPGLAPVDTLFIHGNLASNVWWEPTVETWKSRARKSTAPLPGSLILAEWRGSGKSSGAASVEGLEMKSLANDYVRLLGHLGVKKADLVAHSTGGLIALLAMAEAPSLFGKAVLLDPVSPKGITLDPALLGAMDAMKSDRAMCSAVLASTIQGCKTESSLFQRIVDSAMGLHPLNWRGVTEVLGRTRLMGEMTKVTHPVLILRGEHDAIIPQADCEELQAGLPTSRLMVLDGQGHSCNVENPERFVSLVQEFLNH